MTTSLPQREQLKIDKLLAQLFKLKAVGASSDDSPKRPTASEKSVQRRAVASGELSPL